MSGFADFERYDAVGLADLVRRGKVTPADLLDAAIDRVEARNPVVNAVVIKLYDYGRRAIADGLPDGPLRGVPFLVKDLTASIAGVPMTRGSKFFAGSPPPAADSEHVRRLKRAGLVIFGRTNTCEMGLSLTCEPQLHGPTKNPWDPTRISGGSSGGAAAAVGARMLPTAHATDGFGSIRAPAACCGLVGLKPTRARNTMAPYLGEGLGGLSAEHAVTLTVRDSAALLDATAGAAPGDPYAAPPQARTFREEVGADPGALRIAFTSLAPNGAKVEAESSRVLVETAKLCADLGHRVEEADPEVDRAAVVPTFMTIVAANTVVNLGTHPAAARRGREDHLGDGEARREGQRRRLRPRDPDGPPPRSADGRLPRALGRLADAGARDPTSEARLDRHDDGRRGRVLAARLRLLAVHGLVQLDRPAGDRPPARAFGHRPARRRPARRARRG